MLSSSNAVGNPDPGEPFDLEKWVNTIGLDTNGSFKLPRDSGVRHLSAGIGNELSSEIITSSDTLSVKPLQYPSVYNDKHILTSGSHDDRGWNVSAIMSGDSTQGFTLSSFYGSSTLDGAAVGFWKFTWDTLEIQWKPQMASDFISWPYRAVTRKARALLRNGFSPCRLSISTEGYGTRTALILIKEQMKSWLISNPGFCLLIGGPASRPSNDKTKQYFIRCFGQTPYRSSGRSCVLDTILNVSFLLLGKDAAKDYCERIISCMLSASRRLRPYSESKPEVSDLIHLGHIGPILQDLGGQLSLRRVKNIPRHGHRENAHRRFNWIFRTGIHGKLYIVRLYEAGVVDHAVVVDCRRWPGLIYDSADLYPMFLTSMSLFRCGGPDASKLKITQMYEVIRFLRRRENPSQIKRQLKDMPRGSKRSRSAD